MWRDLAYGARMLARSPLFTLVAVLALGLGLGAATTAFGAFNSIRLKPLPLVPEQHRLVAVTQTLANEPGGDLGLSFPDYRDFGAQARTFDGPVVHQARTFILTDGGGPPERVLGNSISARMFAVLGVKPRLGRDFLPEEEGPDRPPVVLLGHALWQRRYGGDTNLVGRTISISGSPATVVGVMPPGWRFPEESDIWMPGAWAEKSHPRAAFFLRGLARLQPGVTRAEAQAEADMLAARLAVEHPEVNAAIGLRLDPLRDSLTADVGRQTKLLLGAVMFVLLIACANVANLLLARGAQRSREIAVRLALGAGRGRLVRQLLTESLLLGLLGGGLGFILGLWGRDLCRAGIGRELPFWTSFDFDGRVFAFAVVITLVSVAVFGLAPALQTVRSELMGRINEGTRSTGGGRRQQRLRQALVVGEIALALVLLVGAGLMVRSFVESQNADPGYRAEGAFTFRVGLPPDYYTNKLDYPRFFDAVLVRLRALPGVEAAGAISVLPGVLMPAVIPLQIEGRAELPLHESPRAEGRIVTDGALEALGIRLLEGRLITRADLESAPPVAVVDEAFARANFPGASPLGRRIRILGEKDEEAGRWLTVVGVVRTIRARYSGTVQQPMVYVPHAQFPEAFLSVVVRTGGDPAGCAAAAQREVFAVNGEIPIYHPRTMREVIARETWDKRFFGALFAAFAGIALFLAALGIYGVTAWSVGQRTREIGLRIALGADAREVLGLVLRQGVRLVAAGLGTGLAAALLLARLLEGVLYGIKPYDPPIFAAVPVLLALVAGAACLPPALRATRIAPMQALRCE
ncbi:MAG TPA: ABC transporter permease [Verrucomicrobiota bacterium]|nr:ABC transporter permease [Verrucomicrobiota bacterium]